MIQQKSTTQNLTVETITHKLQDYLDNIDQTVTNDDLRYRKIIHAFRLPTGMQLDCHLEFFPSLVSLNDQAEDPIIHNEQQPLKTLGLMALLGTNNQLILQGDSSYYQMKRQAVIQLSKTYKIAAELTFVVAKK